MAVPAVLFGVPSLDEAFQAAMSLPIQIDAMTQQDRIIPVAWGNILKDIKHFHLLMVGELSIGECGDQEAGSIRGLVISLEGNQQILVILILAYQIT